MFRPQIGQRSLGLAAYRLLPGRDNDLRVITGISFDLRAEGISGSSMQAWCAFIMMAAD
ncbi:hypothetical protein [Bradyrhizobium sp.]|uniref:hypothetical protein n=1 Tax=Bradyrhizobium sp. TaxID=376 RepID=UPI003C7D51E7